MKHLAHGITLCLAALVLLFPACKAVDKASNQGETSQGKPYELIVVCPQPQWDGALGDTLRVVLAAPDPYLDRVEPRFDLLHVTEKGFTKFVYRHRNILKIVADPEVAEPQAGVQYDRTAAPQIEVTLQAPDYQAVTDYVSEHRAELLQLFESAERNRAVAYAATFRDNKISGVIHDIFGVEMDVPSGYLLAKQTDDFVWCRLEYPQASQGFMIYSYPYEGTQSLSPEALKEARKRFVKNVPGPSDGSYMTTSPVYEPEYRMFRSEGRLWAELRGFWDLENDFMGGPFVSWSTVDENTGRVVTLEGFIYSPNKSKRNYMRGVEHLFYSFRVPDKQ